jgi:7-cyano-7-deazaguanine synthase
MQSKTHTNVVIYSGGVDSFTLLNDVYEKARVEGDRVFAISFDYGQRHRVELKYAERYADELGVQHKIVDLSSIAALMTGSALTDKDVEVPEGHYADATMRKTVVPNRNMIMISIAAAYALSLDEENSTVFYGAHSGDHAIYPDCRLDFVIAVEAAINTGNYGKLRVEAPYIDMHKGEIVARGLSMKLDYSKASYARLCRRQHDQTIRVRQVRVVCRTSRSVRVLQRQRPARVRSKQDARDEERGLIQQHTRRKT